MVKQKADAAPTRQRIVGLAVDLFYEQGYNATSLRQVAEAVGVQVGSLYNHMSSKEELLFDIMRSIMDDLIADAEVALAQVGDEPLDRIMAFMRTSIRFHAERQKETFIGNTELRGLSEARREQIIALRDRYENLLRTELEAARDLEVLDIEELKLATFAGLAICNSVATWYRADGRLTLEEIERLLPHLFGPLAAHDVEQAR